MENEEKITFKLSWRKDTERTKNKNWELKNVNHHKFGLRIETKFTQTKLYAVVIDYGIRSTKPYPFRKKLSHFVIEKYVGIKLLSNNISSLLRNYLS